MQNEVINLLVDDVVGKTCCFHFESGRRLSGIITQAPKKAGDLWEVNDSHKTHIIQQFEFMTLDEV